MDSFDADDRPSLGGDTHALMQVPSRNEASLEEVTRPWRQSFDPWVGSENESNPMITKLSVEAAKLKQQWEKFQNSLPPDERTDLKNKLSAQEIVGMVKKASERWQSGREKGKRGKAANYFHRFCGTLDAHSNMMKIIPNGNQYVSIFTGTATSIIKASVNHEQIAEDLAMALCTISEHITDCEIELELFKTQAMMEAVVDLYAHIFLFLNDTMEWYIKKRHKRLMDSFNEKFYERFQDEIEKINRKSEIIKRRATQNTAAEQRVTRLTLERADRDMRIGVQGVMRQQAEIMYGQQQLNSQMERDRAEWRESHRRFESLHTKLQSLLTDESYLHNRRSPPRRLLYDSDPTTRGYFESYSEVTKRDDLLLDSACLEDFFYRDRIRRESEHFSPNMIDTQALACLTEWTTSTEVRILNLAGPYFEGNELENPVSMLSAQFIDFAVRSDVPVISYFCELRRQKKLRPGTCREAQGLIGLLYALIRQAAELIPPVFETDKDFSIERFEKLDGTSDSFDMALELLHDIKMLLPRRILCVIDGLQWVDDRTTADYVAQIVQTLRDERIKVLFTTSGQSRFLIKSLLTQEVCTLDTEGDELWNMERDICL